MNSDAQSPGRCVYGNGKFERAAGEMSSGLADTCWLMRNQSPEGAKSQTCR